MHPVVADPASPHAIVGLRPGWLLTVPAPVPAPSTVRVVVDACCVAVTTASPAPSRGRVGVSVAFDDHERADA